MPLYRERVQAVLFKIESVSGQDANPVGTTDAIRMKGIPEITVDYLEPGDRADVQTGVLSGADDTFAAGAYGHFDLTVELIPGSGSPPSLAALPYADALWRASGLVRFLDTTPGAEVCRYNTIDQYMETATAYCYCAGKLIRLVGCAANPQIKAVVNQVVTLTFTITGKFLDITEAAVPNLIFRENNGGVASPWNGSLSKIGSWTSATGTDPLMALEATINLGNVVTDLPSAGAADGLVGYAITDRAVTQDLTLYVPQLATFDPFALSRSAFGSQVTSWGLLQFAQYSKCTFSTRWKPRAPKFGSRSGMKTYTLNGVCRIGSGLTSGREFEVAYS